MFCWQIGHFKRILLFPEFLIDVFFTFVQLVFLSDFFVNFVFLNDLFVHLWRKTIPSVFFAFMVVKSNIGILGCDIIRCNFLICKLGPNFSGPLGAVLFGMTHCATVLAGPFSKGCGLVGFLNLIIGSVDLRFGLE